MTMHEGRIVFMGTPEFSVPILSALCDNGFAVVGVVTQPDRPTGRKKILTPPPIKVEANKRNLPVIQPVKVRHEDALGAIRAWQPDVLVTCAYGQLLPQALLELPAVGSINVHASLLPRWRGAAPIQRAIMAGDAETGISIMEMVAALDAGPVYGTRVVPIGPNDNFGVIHDGLAAAGSSLLAELLPAYIEGRLPGVPQSEEDVTYAHRIERQDEWITWNATRRSIHDHVRGLSPWPGAATRLGNDAIKIWATAVHAMVPSTLAQPGTVICEGDDVLVACGDGWLRLLELQPAGKRKMSAGDWFRGIKTVGVRLEDHPPSDSGSLR